MHHDSFSNFINQQQMPNIDFKECMEEINSASVIMEFLIYGHQKTYRCFRNT